MIDPKNLIIKMGAVSARISLVNLQADVHSYLLLDN